jgi:hypothetical protein
VANRTVRAIIDLGKKQVTLVGDPNQNLNPPITFGFDNDDTISWALEDVEGNRPPRLGEGKVRINFQGKPLFKLGNGVGSELQAAKGASEIGGALNNAVPDGTYSYAVELVGLGPDPIRLNCLWAWKPGDPRNGTPEEMGGAEKPSHP